MGVVLVTCYYTRINTMGPCICRDVAFFQSLRQFDKEIFLTAKAQGCPHCGGPLDTANYLRKTRGMAEENELRFSLCCRREGCRKRRLPPSVRFLGRRVLPIKLQREDRQDFSQE